MQELARSVSLNLQKALEFHAGPRASGGVQVLRVSKSPKPKRNMPYSASHASCWKHWSTMSSPESDQALVACVTRSFVVGAFGNARVVLAGAVHLARMTRCESVVLAPGDRGKGEKMCGRQFPERLVCSSLPCCLLYPAKPCAMLGLRVCRLAGSSSSGGCRWLPCFLPPIGNRKCYVPRGTIGLFWMNCSM
jgi:hypothetical protein